MADSAGAKTEVDITSLEITVPWLEDLANYVDGLIARSSPRLHIDPVPGDDDNPTVADATFGAHETGRTLAQKNALFYGTMLGGLKELQRSLRDTAEGTKRIIANYSTAEDRNHAAATQIAALLSGGGATVAVQGAPPDRASESTPVDPTVGTGY